MQSLFSKCANWHLRGSRHHRKVMWLKMPDGREYNLHYPATRLHTATFDDSGLLGKRQPLAVLHQQLHGCFWGIQAVRVCRSLQMRILCARGAQSNALWDCVGWGVSLAVIW